MTLPGQAASPCTPIRSSVLGLLASAFILILSPATSAQEPAAPEAVTPAPVLRVVFVGDILLEASWKQPPPVPGPLFDHVRARLAEADLVIGNLEEPLTNYPTVTPHKNPKAVAAGRDFVFRATSPQAAQALRDAGIDIATLANNHTMDYTEQGLLDTLERLESVGVVAAGGGENLREAEQVKVFEIKGVRVGILSLSDVVPKYYWAESDRPGIASAKYLGRVRRVIRRARPQADVLIVAFHWGEMFTPRPNEREQELARVAQQAGADLVLGAHPHVLQGVGCLEGAPVVYSAGNFVFPTKNAKAKRSAIFEVAVEGGKIGAVRVVPILLDAEGIPHLATGSVARGILAEMDELSTELGATFADGSASCPQ